MLAATTASAVTIVEVQYWGNLHENTVTDWDDSAHDYVDTTEAIDVDFHGTFTFDIDRMTPSKAYFDGWRGVDDEDGLPLFESWSFDTSPDPDYGGDIFYPWCTSDCKLALDIGSGLFAPSGAAIHIDGDDDGDAFSLNLTGFADGPFHYNNGKWEITPTVQAGGDIGYGFIYLPWIQIDGTIDLWSVGLEGQAPVPQAVPEPGTLLMLFLGTGALLVTRQRRR